MGAPQFGLDNYIGAFNFKVTIDGIEVENAKFTSVSGVVSTSETMEFMQGDDRFVMKQPGRAMFEDIELKRVYQQVDSFYQWREMIERALLSVSLLLFHCFFLTWKLLFVLCQFMMHIHLNGNFLQWMLHLQRLRLRQSL